jgi:hypothetical protein
LNAKTAKTRSTVDGSKSWNFASGLWIISKIPLFRLLQQLKIGYFASSLLSKRFHPAKMLGKISYSFKVFDLKKIYAFP